VPDRVHAYVNRVEPATLDAMGDRTTPEAEPPQLVDRHEAVLARGKPGYAFIDMHDWSIAPPDRPLDHFRMTGMREWQPVGGVCRMGHSCRLSPTGARLKAPMWRDRDCGEAISA
jgi:hypothetical protein